MKHSCFIQFFLMKNSYNEGGGKVMAFKKLHKDENFNFQLNRLLAYGEEACDVRVLEKVAMKAKDFESWHLAWRDEAKKAFKKDLYMHSMYYYRMAEFFLLDIDSRKDEMYKKMRQSFDLSQAKAVRHKVDFQGDYLPCLVMEAQNQRGKLLIHGGYDSFIEEFYLICRRFVDHGFTVILFEGEGQGGTLRSGMKFNHQWEHGVTAVLDAFHIEHCGLIGISWGGFLALRASAFEKRIRYAVAYDVMYDGLDVQFSLYKGFAGYLIRLLYKLKMKSLINQLVKRAMKQSYLAKWAIEHGMYITGAETPYDFYCSIEAHTLKGLLDKIDQDVLLLAGEKDHYIPSSHFDILKKGLSHTRVSSRLFTEEEGGEQHCQVGNYQLAIDEIIDFMTTL